MEEKKELREKTIKGLELLVSDDQGNVIGIPAKDL